MITPPPPAIRPLLGPVGFIHRADLIDRGWRPDRIREAVRREGLLVVRRAWILHPDAPDAVHLAARIGGRVTCISGGALHGLWHPGVEPDAHIALPAHSSSRCAKAVLHRAIGVVPAPPRSLVDPVENVLARVAACRPFEEALTVWESAMNCGLVTREQLTRIAWRGDRARRLAEAAGILSDSGLETLVVHRMSRVGVIVRQQVTLLGHRVDGLVGEMLVLQIDGFTHHRDARQRQNDIAHDRMLRLHGYTVLRFSYHEVIGDWPRVEAQILRAVAQGLHLSRLPAFPR